MNPVITLLTLAARHGRMLLVAGLVAGIALPGVAIAFKPWLQEMVAALLFIAALRIGPRQALGAIRNLPVVVGIAAVYQLALPLTAIAVLTMAGWTGAPLATALVLMLAASSISGSPNLTILTGHDPAPALRLLIIGTAILPFTVLPVFWLLPELGTAAEVIGAASRLFAAIAIATAAAFLVRGVLLRDPAPRVVEALDGLSAIAMAVVVVGLMSAVGPAVTGTPLAFLGWLAIAFAANFGLQALAALVLTRTSLRDRAVPFAIIAGNRNIALFLVALPAHVTDPVLLFIGCYQIPMYLTPLLMRGFYNRIERRTVRA
ncbi:hypothetical protein [Oricola indica]|uniref:hypothetical protein n=1 Tax=Oricola indica TaxID=2872591 RepID=UPI003CCC1289